MCVQCRDRSRCHCRPFDVVLSNRNEGNFLRKSTSSSIDNASVRRAIRGHPLAGNRRAQLIGTSQSVAMCSADQRAPVSADTIEMQRVQFPLFAISCTTLCINWLIPSLQFCGVHAITCMHTAGISLLLRVGKRTARASAQSSENSAAKCG